ncbi:MAG: phytanoyl-CoA dioxygenase family protein [Myxococcales bacterium]|nr:phytanoyl-CoA dioxygenase family protein [Myxococcales bacterium]MCB9716977.1 phytanoyl-CoA dioxygenase family protein [Myxococcales bacterium]
MTISEQQAQRYHENGFLAPVPILGPEEAARYRQRFDGLEARIGRPDAQLKLLDAHLEERFVWEIATHPRILDALEAVIGPDILLLGTHFICKYGEALQPDAFIAWHQDLTYWGLEPPVAITAWYAIDDCDLGNGCMQMIPGSHRSGISEHGKSERVGNMLRINQAVALDPADERRAVDVVLRAGEVSLHDGLVVHGSPPNRSGRRRCGLASKYVPAHVRQVAERSHTRSKAIVVRGEDRQQHFAPLAPPFRQGGSPG